MFDYYDDVMKHMEDELDRLTAQALGTWIRQQVPPPFWQPRVDVCEYADRLIVKFEVGQLNAQRLKVSLSADGRVLMVRGWREEEPGEVEGRLRCHQLEIYYGPFARSVSLPGHIAIDRDEVTSTYKDGFLEVILPARQPAPAHKVEIT